MTVRKDAQSVGKSISKGCVCFVVALVVVEYSWLDRRGEGILRALA